MEREEWWRQVARTRPFEARTPTDVRAELVPEEEFGAIASIVLVPGTRIWAFFTEEARDKFLSDVERGAFRRRT